MIVAQDLFVQKPSRLVCLPVRSEIPKYNDVRIDAILENVEVCLEFRSENSTDK